MAFIRIRNRERKRKIIKRSVSDVIIKLDWVLWDWIEKTALWDCYEDGDCLRLRGRRGVYDLST